MKIQEIMTTPAVTCRQNDTLNTAAQLMWEHDNGAVVVVNGDGKVVGMVTDRDVCMAAYTQGRPLREIPVSKAMAKTVFSCHPGDSLEAGERVMITKQIRRLPVLDGEDRPIGLLSLNDIARYAASSKSKNGKDREVTQTLGAICQPRRLAIQSASKAPTKSQRQVAAS